jgi:hypothetical protein
LLAQWTDPGVRDEQRCDPQIFLSTRSAFDFGFCPYAKHGKGAESGVERIDTGQPLRCNDPSLSTYLRPIFTYKKT